MQSLDVIKSTQEMLFYAFPNGIGEECYWILLYLLYDYMADENLALVMSSLIKKPIGIIENDIYKVPQLQLDKKKVKEIKYKLDIQGFEEWKKEE